LDKFQLFKAVRNPQAVNCWRVRRWRAFAWVRARRKCSCKLRLIPGAPSRRSASVAPRDSRSDCVVAEIHPRG